MIKNRAALAKFHGHGASLALGALEAALKSVEPGALVRQALKFRPGSIEATDILGRTLAFGDFRDIYIVGAGKAAGAMADAACTILKSGVAGGAITVPYGTKIENDHISVTCASHPVPDENGVRGTEKIVAIMEKAGKDDLVVVLISGGGSALMPLPSGDLSLEGKQRATVQLLASGASIHEINVVRKHLSEVKGGQLVRRTRAKVVTLILSDVMGDDLGVIASGPTYPDSSTFADALRIVKEYGITGPAIKHIARGAQGLVKETPKQGDPVFRRVSNLLVGNNELACKSAAGYLSDKGLRVENLGSRFDGEAKDFGVFAARLAGNLAKRPFALVAGGETTVRLGKRAGIGGRNQEAALACAIAMQRAGIVVAFMGTDGVDGNSDAAGAIVSTKSVELAKKIGKRYLAHHDSYHALKEMNSLIFTGPTGTNVNDIMVIVSAQEARRRA